MRWLVAVVFALPFLACSVSVETSNADAPMSYRGECVERVEGEWWAAVEVPASPEALARAGVMLDLPAGAGESMGVDGSLRFYRPQLVVFDEGLVDVWCGDSDVSAFAVVVLP